MANFIVNLPAINGRFEVGLSVGIDAVLANDAKLPVLWPVDISGERTPATFDMTRAVGYAMEWVANRNANNQFIATYAAAAQIIIRANLLREFRSGEITFHDGDFIIVAEVDPQIPA